MNNKSSNIRAMKALSKFAWSIGLACLITLAGCTTGKTPGDPYESLNRKTFAFNMKFDKLVLRPIAKTYNAVTPNYVQARVTNFFNNTGGIPATINDALQLNVYQTFADGSRFLINSTLGICGLYDVAAHGNLPEHHNDFGLTMARWGLKDSPYFMIPVLGPSTIRDTAGLPVDVYTSIWAYVQPQWISYAAFGLDKINIRAALLPSDKLVDQAYDPYVFVRDAYLQHRQNEVNAVFSHAAPGAPDTSTAPVSQSGDTFVAGEAGAVRVNEAVSGSDPFVPAEGPGSTAATTPAAEQPFIKSINKKKPAPRKLPAPTQLIHH